MTQLNESLPGFRELIAGNVILPGDAVWKRLVETKRKWDPENVFRMNQNIAP